ncbi:MAG: T9SS type A sorting domain-containing protein [Bacteroidia bacterium]
MRRLLLLSFLAIGVSLLFCDTAQAQTTVQIGTGSSSSSTRGPFQRADTNSSTVFSRWVQIYTQAELAAAGVTVGSSISELQWEVASSNVIIGTGDATLKIYVKNSAATMATTDTWANLTAGSTLVLDAAYNTTNNFPGANGWMPFTFSTPFTYTGGALEIATDWDCSQVSTPAFNGNGAIKFRWESTAPNDLVVKKTASSSAPSSLSDLKDERANIQIVFNTTSCAAPTNLGATNITTTSADLSWVDTSAVAYDWKVVLAGAGSAGTAVDGGNTTNNSVTASNLMALTSYDLFVTSDCGNDTSDYAGPYTFLTAASAQTTVMIGMGTSSSSTRGPFQRSDTNSSTVFSRFVHIYTQNELAAAGINGGDLITELAWELASSNVMIGNGNATLKVYVRNSAATSAISDTWVNHIAGSTLAVDHAYNTSNNFPGANGWMPFSFTSPFMYTGDALEIAVDWDCSQVSTPAFSGDGSLKWRWESTAPDDLVVKKTASSSPSSTITDLKDERANIQFTLASPSCDPPLSLNVTNITSTTADLSWVDSTATAFNWKVVLAGAGSAGAAVDGGTATANSVTTSILNAATAYDLFVAADCAGTDTSDYAGPYNFTTLCAATPATTITTAITNVSCFGDSNGAIDLTVVAGVPGYDFSWSNADTTEDISGLSAGTYNITIIDGDGCPYTDSVVVTEPTLLVVSSTAVADSANTGIGSISVTASGGTMPYTYSWDGTAGPADSTGLNGGTYSIAIVDANGCTDTVSVTVDDVVSIEDIDFITNLTISPNPTNGMAVIDLVLTKNADVSISIYSITGELVKTIAPVKTQQINQQIDLSTFAEGLYFVRFSIDNHVATKKLLLYK